MWNKLWSCTGRWRWKCSNPVYYINVCWKCDWHLEKAWSWYDCKHKHTHTRAGITCPMYRVSSVSCTPTALCNTREEQEHQAGWTKQMSRWKEDRTDELDTFFVPNMSPQKDMGLIVLRQCAAPVLQISFVCLLLLYCQTVTVISVSSTLLTRWLYVVRGMFYH